MYTKVPIIKKKNFEIYFMLKSPFLSLDKSTKIENIIRRMDKILEIAEKVREKLMEEIRFYMDSKHLIGICDKM